MRWSRRTLALFLFGTASTVGITCASKPLAASDKTADGEIAAEGKATTRTAQTSVVEDAPSPAGSDSRGQARDALKSGTSIAAIKQAALLQPGTAADSAQPSQAPTLPPTEVEPEPQPEPAPPETFDQPEPESSPFNTDYAIDTGSTGTKTDIPLLDTPISAQAEARENGCDFRRLT